ncbi:conjugal transfer protein TraD [Sphingomonas sp. HF-S4]|uniref:Conjugal transfer protein TraD n=1 Tax=Sphingomonas agrestis TaxID=3080540 RepID=A0ABU3YCW1_9SPHN|nr:conjugal transfer protein TraD [Sphingomonas sp. HF-S4]MDV3459223.1 conjugal transfer protein TraD [Sphingomonas sp. HF-S4]
MRKPRDFEAELKTLNHRASQLKQRKLVQLGELVIATGADGLPVEVLAGALLSAVESADATIKEGWRKRGVTFFQRGQRKVRGITPPNSGGEPARNGGAQSTADPDRA